jgi:hypothetical protein
MLVTESAYMVYPPASEETRRLHTALTALWDGQNIPFHSSECQDIIYLASGDGYFVTRSGDDWAVFRWGEQVGDAPGNGSAAFVVEAATCLDDFIDAAGRDVSIRAAQNKVLGKQEKRDALYHSITYKIWEQETLDRLSEVIHESERIGYLQAMVDIGITWNYEKR